MFACAASAILCDACWIAAALASSIWLLDKIFVFPEVLISGSLLGGCETILGIDIVPIKSISLFSLFILSNVTHGEVFTQND